MTLVSAHLPDDLVRSIDRIARSTNMNRTEIVHAAVELYLVEIEQQLSTLDRLSHAPGLSFDWEDVEHTLLAKD
jgi:predicted transcriptional regulator